MNDAERSRDVDELFTDDRIVTRSLRRAVREAMRRHKQAECPVVVWRRGKVVWVPPEEIPALDE